VINVDKNIIFPPKRETLKMFVREWQLLNHNKLSNILIINKTTYDLYFYINKKGKPILTNKDKFDICVFSGKRATIVYNMESKFR